MASGAFCPSCGSPTEAGARFCANCGTALHPASPSQPEPPPPGSPPQWSSPGQPSVGGAARQGFGWALGCLVLGFALVLVIALLGLYWVANTTTTPSQPVTPGSTLPALSSGGSTGAATLSGSDHASGPPFTLGGGDYVVTWSATSGRAATSPDSAFYVTLDAASDVASGGETAVDVSIPGGQQRSGTNYLYRVPGGEFHFTVISSDITWQVSIAPR